MHGRMACLTLAFCLSAGSAMAGIVEKAVVFPTADSLRVELSLRAERALPGVALKGSIKPVGGGAELWAGAIKTVDLPASQTTRVEHTITGLKPELWSPGSPKRYELSIVAEHQSAELDRTSVVTGFRSVESRNGQILLNGKPIFLCGLAINPPGRGIPEATAMTREFARDYVRYMRSANFNCIRMNLEFVVDPRAQYWFDACDEFGMLVYQGCYGAPPSGKPEERADKNKVPQDVEASVAAYKEVFETYSRHPAIIVYVLSNELPYTGTRGKAWHEFLIAAYDRLRAWDSTRLYIGNAGYGEGKEGDLNDVHRYWGWYYNSFLTYYNLRQTQELFGDKGAVQPFTFSECVGSFTSTLGEFNLTFKKQLGAQLHWTGHAPDQAEDALAYQAFMAKHACESFRTMRESNPRLAGLMPFTILFYHWNGITRFEQMKPKPVADAMALAYQPVLLSWELWTPQVYAGTTISPWAHVVNDAEDFSALRNARLEYELIPASARSDKKGAAAKATGVAGEADLPEIAYFGHAKKQLSVAIPAGLAGGDYLLEGRIVVDGKTVSRNEMPIFVAGAEWQTSIRMISREKPYVYDPKRATVEGMLKLHIGASHLMSLANPPAGSCLIIGEGAGEVPDLGEFVRGGGRVLILGQNTKFAPSWLPVQIEMLTGSANSPEYYPKVRPTRDQMHINIERPDHPIFAGLDRSRLRMWSDYTDWNQAKKGFPAIYPVTHGFKLLRAEDLSRVAILANYDRGLEGIAVCEVFDGKGSVVMTSFDLVKRIGLDPAADRLLANLVSYLAAPEHPVYPLITEPIKWGRYATERGVVSGPLNGLVVNCRWVRPPTDPKAKPLPDNEGAWNMLPGDQFVPFGRRPFGPYIYNAGTSTRELDRDSAAGSGTFYASLPPGRRSMTTLVENPAKQDATLEVTVNGKKTSFTIPAGKTVPVRCELRDRPATVEVSYRGEKTLVLVETRFE